MTAYSRQTKEARLVAVHGARFDLVALLAVSVPVPARAKQKVTGHLNYASYQRICIVDVERI